jgi:putative hydrolase of HD superfamily
MERLDGLGAVGQHARERLRFLAYAHELTSVGRFVRLVDGSRPENSAEHSWHVGLCAIVLAPSAAPAVNLERVLKMLAVHDLVEIEVGDVPIYDKSARAAVAELERAAATEVFNRLPEGRQLHEVWIEFDALDTQEARFARAVDRLQPILLHWIGGGRLWRSAGIRRQQLDEISQFIHELCPELAALAQAIINDAADRGDFPEDHFQ